MTSTTLLLPFSNFILALFYLRSKQLLSSKSTLYLEVEDRCLIIEADTIRHIIIGYKGYGQNVFFLIWSFVLWIIMHYTPSKRFTPGSNDFKFRYFQKLNHFNLIEVSRKKSVEHLSEKQIHFFKFYWQRIKTKNNVTNIEHLFFEICNKVGWLEDLLYPMRFGVIKKSKETKAISF